MDAIATNGEPLELPLRQKSPKVHVSEDVSHLLSEQSRRMIQGYTTFADMTKLHVLNMLGSPTYVSEIESGALEKGRPYFESQLHEFCVHPHDMPS